MEKEKKNGGVVALCLFILCIWLLGRRLYKVHISLFDFLPSFPQTSPSLVRYTYRLLLCNNRN